MSAPTLKQKKPFQFPHPYALMLIIMCLVVVLSYTVPAGEYGTVVNESGQTVVDPDAFHYLTGEEKSPIGFFDFFGAIHNGLIAGSAIYASLLLLGGILKLVEDSGAFSAGINKILQVSKGKEFLVVIALHLAFVALSCIGFGEGLIPFIPIVVPVVMALGFDRVTAAATPLLGMAIGWTGGLANMFSTAICQRLVGLPIYSGIGYRFLGLVIFEAIGLAYLYFYARKTRKDPSKSLVAAEYMQQKGDGADSYGLENMTWQKGLTLFFLAVVVVLQGIGAIRWGWAMAEISSCYLALGLIVVFLNRMKLAKVCQSFTAGASSMMVIVIMLGFANGINALLKQAKITDTMVHAIAGVLEGKPVVVTLLLFFLIMNIFNFFIVGSTGKAVIMMPILSPLGQLLHINQQVMTLAFIYGDGITNYFYPTSGGMMASLTLCKLDYGVWIKFFWKLMCLLLLTAFILIVIAQGINYGPF